MTLKTIEPFHSFRFQGKYTVRFFYSVDTIKNMYDKSECAITIDGNLTQWFKVNVGVRQGCLLSPTHFNVFLEIVFAELGSLDVVFNINSKLSTDIRYADDSTLLVAIF